jgi:hypothetical protein
MALPPLPSLQESARVKRPVQTMNAFGGNSFGDMFGGGIDWGSVFGGGGGGGGSWDNSPSGTGWGFTPSGGWGIDFSGVGSQGSGFILPGGSGGPSGGDGGIFGPSIGITLPFPGGSSGSGAPGGTSIPGKILGAATGAVSSVLGIPAINWGRIAAFLLGLLLIAGGLYLLKPVQTVVNRSVRGLAETGEVAA